MAPYTTVTISADAHTGIHTAPSAIKNAVSAPNAPRLEQRRAAEHPGGRDRRLRLLGDLDFGERDLLPHERRDLVAQLAQQLADRAIRFARSVRTHTARLRTRTCSAARSTS